MQSAANRQQPPNQESRNATTQETEMQPHKKRRNADAIQKTNQRKQRIQPMQGTVSKSRTWQCRCNDQRRPQARSEPTRTGLYNHTRNSAQKTQHIDAALTIMIRQQKKWEPPTATTGPNQAKTNRVHGTCNIPYCVVPRWKLKKEKIHWGYLPEIPTAFDPVLAGAHTWSVSHVRVLARSGSRVRPSDKHSNYNVVIQAWNMVKGNNT